MKAIIATVISIAFLMGALVFLMEKQQSAFAQTVFGSTATDPGQLSQLPHSHNPQTAYQSGFEHGVIDGNTSSNATSYIDQPKHGFAWHTSEFVTGYVNGFCSITSQ
jgi:hypothetical protein